MKQILNALILMLTVNTLLMADSLKLSVDFLAMDYTEYDSSGSFLDSETSDYGDIAGFEIQYNYRFANGFAGGDEDLIEFSFDYYNGKTDYNGALFSTTTGAMLQPYKNTTDHIIMNPKIRFHEKKRTENYDIGIFTSLGYRYWKRDMQGPYGYMEEYKWFYADIGLDMTISDGNWHLGLESAYQQAIAPTMDAHLGNTMSFDLGNTAGYYLKIPLSYDVNKYYSIECSYQYDYYKIKKSNIVNGYFEPESETKNQIVKIGMIFKW
jgi:hypothetical protein